MLHPSTGLFSSKFDIIGSSVQASVCEDFQLNLNHIQTTSVLRVKIIVETTLAAASTAAGKVS
jgi:hypothetical protein